MMLCWCNVVSVQQEEKQLSTQTMGIIRMILERTVKRKTKRMINQKIHTIRRNERRQPALSRKRRKTEKIEKITRIKNRVRIV